MKNPIFIDVSRIHQSQSIKELETKLDRPVVFVHGDPREVVLDSQDFKEGMRDKIALAVLPAYINDQLFRAKVVDVDEVVSFSYQIADAMIAKAAKK